MISERLLMPNLNDDARVLRSCIIFKDLDDSEIVDLAKHYVMERYDKGSILFETGDDDNGVFLLKSGKLKVTRSTKDNQEAILSFLNPGEIVGELAILGNNKRSARVTCLEDSVVLKFQQDYFSALVKNNTKIGCSLLTELGNRIRSANENFVHQLERERSETENRFLKMQRLTETSKVFNSTLDLGVLLGLVLEAARSGTQADRGTVYLIDDLKGELWSMVLQGEGMGEIRLPIGTGISGHVAKTGETINIPDAYSDPRFNQDSDKKSGYRTKTILTMPMKNKSGKIIGVFQLLNKLTGLFNDEDIAFLDALSGYSSVSIENARLAQEMVQNERLSAVGRMASSIIHDIKNPMSTIRVYAQVMKRKAGTAETAKLSDEMIAQIDRFVNMLQEILDFSRGVSASNFQDVNFNEVMTNVLNFMESDLTKHNVSLVRSEQWDGILKMDQDKMVRVFYNLASNARDAMPNGGTLTVSSKLDNGKVRIEFTDSGTGMPEEVKRKIFEPFVTYGKKHGTGLGMAIVKKVIDDHKGTIEIDSIMGKGTTIRIVLPVPPQ